MPTPAKELTLTQKLAKIQSELKAPKGQYNSFAKFSYRSCEDILGAVKPLLAEHSLVVIVSDKLHEIGSRFYIEATAKVSDGEKEVSATGFARETEEKKGMDSAQITGSASSYARKYALNGLFAIDDTRDPDSMKPPAKNEQKTNDPADWFDPTKDAHKMALATIQKETQKTGKSLVADLRKKYKISKANAAKIERWTPKKPADTTPPAPAAPTPPVKKSWE